MLGSAVDVHLPVDPRLAHLLFEAGALLERDDRIIGPYAHQDLADDLARVLRASRSQAWVKADHRLDICAGSRQLHRDHGSVAVADRGDSRAVNALLRQQCSQAGLAEGA